MIGTTDGKLYLLAESPARGLTRQRQQA